MAWDPMKHPHGEHGRWATVGTRKKVDRSADGRTPGNAFKRPQSAGEARAGKARTVQKVRDVKDLYARHRAGLTTPAEEDRISVAPNRRRKQIRETGSPLRPEQDVVRAARHGLGGTAPRIGVKRTFTGKTRAVRGYRTMDVPHPEHPGSTMEVRDRRVRRTFDLKPRTPKASATASAHPTYTRKQLVLKSDAWMRDELTKRGVTIPKGARTRALVNLLASD